MPRPRPRSTRLETRTARLRLKVRQKPHDYILVTPGIRLGYRRNRGCGRWVMKGSDGHGHEWIKNVGWADDYEEPDNTRILSYWEAVERVRKLVRGNDDNAPATVTSALDVYEADLKARNGNPNNVSRIRHHLAASNLMGKPVALLEPGELARWRNDLITNGLKPATVLRTCKALIAALNLAARHDSRITNRDAWRIGLGGLSDTYNVRNGVLPDNDVRALVASAYEISQAFGIYVEVHAVTGARSSQVAALMVSDLQATGSAPRLMMPGSAKGRGRKAGQRKPVPITVALAIKLKAAAGDRPPSAPLLLRHDSKPWKPRNADHSRLFAQAAERAGLTGHTIYSLRHSSIVRALLNGVPARIVASAHDTSIAMLERTYSAYISDFADSISRRGLLELQS
jgi:integrase